MTIAPNDQRYPEFTIGWRLRLARTRLGAHMDVAAFAELIDVSKNTVTNYELERTAPERMKSTVLKPWAMATGVDLDWLRTGIRPGGEKLPELDSNQQPAGLGAAHDTENLARAA